MHDALALDLHVAAFLEHEGVVDPVIDVLRHLNSAGDIGCLHPRRDIDRVAPHVVEELAGPDHSGHHGPGGQSDPQRHRAAPRILEIGDGVGQVQGQAGQRLDVIGAWLGYAGHHHVGVAGGLDLLQAMAVHQRVEVGVQPVQKPDQIGRGQITGPLGVTGDVGEQDRRVVVFVGDDRARRILEPLGDGRGQNVGQQLFGPLVFGFHRVLGPGDLTQRHPYRGKHHHRGGNRGDHESGGHRPRRPEAPVTGNQDLERDGGGHREGGQGGSEHDALDAQHQDRERCGDHEVELQAGIRTDRKAHRRHRQIGDQEERQRRDQLAEPVQQRYQ